MFAAELQIHLYMRNNGKWYDRQPAKTHNCTDAIDRWCGSLCVRGVEDKRHVLILRCFNGKWNMWFVLILLPNGSTPTEQRFVLRGLWLTEIGLHSSSILPSFVPFVLLSLHLGLSKMTKVIKLHNSLDFPLAHYSIKTFGFRFSKQISIAF